MAKKTNHPPVLAQMPDVEVIVNAQVFFTAMATDPDAGDTLTYSIVSGPGNIGGATGVYTWQPGWANLGPNQVTIRATDQGGLSDNKSFTITVVNHAPTMGPLQDQDVCPNGTVNLTVTGTDADQPPQTLTYSLRNGSSGMINPISGQYSWTPGWGDLGAKTITIRVTDPGGLYAERCFTINVINRVPTMPALQDQQVCPLGTVNVSAMGSDPDQPPQTLTYSLRNASPGMINPSSGQYSWTPGWGDLGAKTVTIRVTDPGGLYAERCFTVSVVNNAPAMSPLQDQYVFAGQSVTFTAMGSDTDSPMQTLTYSLQNASKGSINATSGFYSWTPGQGDKGAHTVTIRVTDPGGLYAQRACTITVS